MRIIIKSICIVTGFLIPVFAQQNDDASRGVARVSVIAGDVSIQRGDSGDNIAATLNAPLVAQDRLSTGPGARAELQFDYANMIRLGSNTAIQLAELQYQRAQINLASGLATFRVWQNSDMEVDINTPVASIRPMRKGEYRVQVLEDGSTEIAVRDGEVDIFTPQGSRRLGEGRSLTIRREANGEPQFISGGAPPIDSWDQWNRSRDRELASSRSNRYLPQGVYGGEQLDAYGDWIYSAPYGYVWSPRVAAGWAPYRTGRWSWLDWYGWTWVSYDPWGWAPYHYGRWFHNAGRWCWWPGAAGPRHYWSPALVSFIGFGSGGFNFGIGFNWGNVGWVPLAPFESYNRWWGRNYYGNRRNNNTIIVNNINVTNVYRNARVDGAVSYVEANQFNRGVAYAGGSGVRAARVSDLGNASEFRGPLGIAPSADSVRYATNDGVRGSTSNFSNRQNQNFTARREAAAIERVPFEQQRQSFDSGTRGAGAGSNAEGWRRVGEASVGSTPGVRGSDAFVQRGNGVRGGMSGAEGDGFRRTPDSNAISPRQSAEGVRGSDGFVSRQRNSGMDSVSPSGNPNGGVRGDNNPASGWQRFGSASVNSGVRGSDSSNSGFVQRDGGTRGMGRDEFSGGSRSRGVGAVDVSPRIVDRGADSYGRGSGDAGRSGSRDPFGDISPRGSSSRDNGSSGWSTFGGVRGGGGGSMPQSSPRMERSAPSMPQGGFGGSRGSYGGGSMPQMRAPSGGGFGGGSRGGGGAMSAPSGGGVRGGGGAAPARSGGGGRRGGGQ